MMKNNLFYLIITVFLINIVNKSKAQNFNCGTSAAQEELYKKYPELRQQQTEFDAYVLNYIQEHYQEANRNLIIIPIVFHVVHDFGTENISDAQILDQVAILNRDYNLMNSDTSEIVKAFKSYKSNIGIEFRLAQKDPQGNCTNGIDRIASPLTYLGNDAAKLNPWDRRNYLNVWTVKKMENGVAGYAYMPLSVSGINFPIDGIIILHDYIGSIGTANADRSRALTHEIGHWLNLSHPWGDNNNPGQACGDDGIPDTPITKGHTDCIPVADYSCDINNFNNALYSFDHVTPLTGTNDPTVPPNQSVSSIIKLNFTNFIANGVELYPATDSVFAFRGWDNGATNADTSFLNLTGAINPSKYYEFTIVPEFTQAMTISSITFKVNRNDEGVRTYCVRSSIDNFTTNIPATVLPVDTANLRVQQGNIFYIKNDINNTLVSSTLNLGTAFSSIDKPVSFRIYAYNAESSNGIFGIDDFKVSGNYGLVENVQNYMDYSYCSIMFTEGQKQAMYAALSSDVSFRNNLYTNENLIQTGVLSPTVCAPKADFFALAKYICVGTSVSFKDNSGNAEPTTWNWSFPGGSPSSSNLQNPAVNYSSPGIYQVSLTVSNGLGSNTTTKDSYIVVSPNWSDYNSTYVESFANISLAERWNRINASNNNKKWQLVPNAGALDNSSMMLSGFYQGEGDVDELITPSYDLRYMTNINLNFKYLGAAMSTNVSDMRDSLTVYVSIDCGKSWGAPKLTIKRANLIKAGQVASWYVPNSGDAWSNATLSLDGTYAVANVRFRFRYTSGQFTNNFYLDDFNISGVVSVSELTDQNNVLNVSPNPFYNEANITLNINKTEKVTIDLMDITGRKIRNVFEGIQTNQLGNYKLEKQNLSQGIYLVKAQIGENQIFKKVIIE